MSIDEDDGRIWQPGHDEIRLVAGGLPLGWRYDWRSRLAWFLLGFVAGVVSSAVLALLVIHSASLRYN
jgi:hypothetical protein